MALREILAKFGFEIDDSKLKAARQQTNAFSTQLKEVAGVFLGGALVQGIRTFVSDLTAQADQLADTSAQLGVGAQELQRWQLAAKLSGAEANDLTAGLRNISKAANDGKGQGEIKKLGISLTDASGKAKSATQLMGDVGLEIAKLPNATERTAKALELFGKSGTKLLPMFAEGEEGLAKMLDRLDELGGGIGDEALDLLTKAGDATDEFNIATLSLKSRLAVDLFPAINAGIGWVTKFVAGLSKATEGTNVFKAAVIVMGAAAVRAAVGMYARYLPMAALLAILVILVDDFITFVEGGDSAIGRFLDSILGTGAASDIAKAMRDDWRDLKEELDKFPDVGSKVEHAFSTIGASLVRFVVDDLPEAWGIFWQRMNDEADTGGSTFGDYLGDKLYYALDAASMWLWSGIDSMTEGLGDRVRAAGDDIATAIKLVTMPTNVLGLLSEFGVNLAIGIIDGIVEGFKSGAGRIEAAFSDAAGVIERKARSMFDWNSPAGWGVDFADGGIGAGVVKGFARARPKIEAGAADAFQAIPDAAAYAPPAPAPRRAAGGLLAGPDGVVRVDVSQTIHAPVQVHATNATEAQRGVQQGLREAFREDRRGLLNSLTHVAPEPT